MVDGASKLDEKLDGAPFAMFVLAALQLQLRMELSATSGNLTVCWSATTRANSTLTRSSSSTTRTRTRTSSLTLKTYQRVPLVRMMIWEKGWKGVRIFCHKKRLKICVFAVVCKGKIFSNESCWLPQNLSEIFFRFWKLWCNGFSPDLFLKELLFEFGKVVDWEAPCHQYSLSPPIEDDAPYGSVVN